MEKQEWTIMVYMAGDNNLSVDMAYAMQQIKEFAGEDTEKVNLFVYYDGYSEAIPTLYCDFSDHENPKHVRSFMVPNKLYPVEGKTDENAADHRSIINFVDWCVNKVPHEVDGKTEMGRRANRYALIFSGHSMGFQDIGMFKDESADQAMSMEKMNWLLERITKSKDELTKEIGDAEMLKDDYNRETTEILGQKLDILGFDSCVMSMLEVGNQFDSVARTMVASEGSVPNAGWTYAKILGNLASQSSDIPVTEVAANFVNEFVRSQDSYTIGGVAVDMAAWDMSSLPDLNKEFQLLAEKILECFNKEGGTVLYRQMERVLLQVHWKCQTYMFEQNVDLGDFCELLGAECRSLMKEIGGEAKPLLKEVKAQCDAVLRELNNVVLLSGFSGGKYQYSNGISLFFPWSLASYDISRENYESLDFVQNTGAGKRWNQFLDTYLRDITFRRALTPTDTGVEPGPIVLEMKAGAETPSAKLRYYSYEYKDYSPTENLADVEAYFEGSKIGGVEGSKIGGVEGSKIGGVEGSKIGGVEGSKIGGVEGSKIGGVEGSKIGGVEGSKIGGVEGSKIGGVEGSKIGGVEGSKIGGVEGSKIGGVEGSKIGGVEGSKIGGVEGSKIGGVEGSKIGGVEGSKIGGVEGSKIGGVEGSKIGGVEGSKIGGVEGSKIGGVEGSKIGGVEGSKIGGVEGSKIGGVEGSKIGGGGSGGGGAFIDTFKHFKNIETPWNLSGFTKDPKELTAKKEMKKTTS